MPPLTGRDGRSRLPVFVAAAIVLIAAAALGAYFLRANRAAPDASPSRQTTPSGTVSAAEEDTAPTGCLGGQARTTAMVLTTRRLAPHTAYGAVEVAAALTRWGLRYPYPSRSELNTLEPAFTPATAAVQTANLAKEYANGYRPLPGRSDPSGTGYYVTTANGDWLVSPDSTTNDVTVQLEAHPVIAGAYSVKAVTLAANLRWSKSGWQVHNFARADSVALANGGTTFTSGC